MATVQYNACVTLSENKQVDIYTMRYKGSWEWFGSEKDITGRDELGCRVLRLVRNVDCGDARYDSSAAAIVAAVARYGDVPEDWGLTAVEDIIIDGDADKMLSYSCEEEEPILGIYPALDPMPPGWDAQDHKALYE